MTRAEYERNNNDYYERLERIATVLLAAYVPRFPNIKEFEVGLAISAAAGLIETIDGLRNGNDETS